MLPPNTLALVGLSKPLRYLKGTADQGLMSRQPEIFYSIYIYNIYVDARLCVTISRQITIIIYPTESLRRKEIFQNRIAALEVRLGTPLVLSKPPDRRGGSTPQWRSIGVLLWPAQGWPRSGSMYAVLQLGGWWSPSKRGPLLPSVRLHDIYTVSYFP